MRRLLNISLSSVPALIGAGICFLPVLYSKSIGINSHSFFSTLSLTTPVLTILFIWIQSFLFPRKTGYTVDNFWIYYDPGSGCLREIESFIVDPNKAICIQSIN